MEQYNGHTLRESDVEAAFVEYINKQQYFHVIGRQVELPFGILDVLGTVTDAGGCVPFIAEIKLDQIDLKACGQLWGYMGQVDFLLQWEKADHLGEYTINNQWQAKIHGILVGRSIQKEALRIILSSSATYFQYTIENGKIIFSEPETPFESLCDYEPHDPRLTTLFQEIIAYEKSRIPDIFYRQVLSNDTTKNRKLFARDWQQVIDNTVAVWKAK